MGQDSRSSRYGYGVGAKEFPGSRARCKPNSENLMARIRRRRVY